MASTPKNLKDDFFERPFEETEDGFYDERGFYMTPNGSFWDEDRQYFNRNGFDIHGGKYDKYGVYFPGEGWNEELNCYEEDINISEDKEKVYTKIFDNINRELVEGSSEIEKILKEEEKKNKEGNEITEEDDEIDDSLTEDQMKEIFDQALMDHKNQSIQRSVQKLTFSSVKKISNSKEQSINK